MRSFKFAAALLAAALPSLAFAQSSPGLQTGQVPTAAQWNSYFAAKQDVLGFTPFGSNGGTLTGKLTTAAPTTARAGLALPPGTAPTSPINGDIWTTTAGLFARINGSTVGPFASSAGTGLTVGSTTIGSATDTYVMFNNAGTLGEYSISGTGSVVMTTSPTITTPSVSYGTTGSSKTILATSANTGFGNTLSVGNGGTATTAGTIAALNANLTAGTNTFAQLLVTGAASPTATLSTGSGITGGFTITSGSGPLNLTTPTMLYGTGANSTIKGFSANTAFSNIFTIDNSGTSSNGTTIATSQVTLSAGSSVSAGLSITGGATPTASLITGAGVTGGFNISAGAGTLTLVAPTTTGKLTTAASTTSSAGFSCPAGAAPTSPVNGDFWCTTAGAFYRANGVTQGPFGTGGGSLPAINDGQVLANTSGSSAQPVGTNGTTWFDKAWCNTAGYIIARAVSVWTCSNSIPINAVWFGAVGNGTTDDTNAIKAALAVSGAKPVYLPRPATCYLVSSDMAVASGQEVYGDGRSAPTLCVKVAGGFTKGVFTCPGSGIQPGPTIRDMVVTFTQPNPTPAATTSGSISGTTLTVVNGSSFAIGQTVGPVASAVQPGLTLTAGSGNVWTIAFSQPSYSGPIYTYSVNAMRAQLTQYKPFLYCQNSPRASVRHVLVQGAWDGFDMRDNSGGMVLDDLQISAFNVGIYIDGSLDANHLSKIHCWSFNVGNTQYDALVQTPNGGAVATGSRCLDIGRSDGLNVVDMSTSLQLGVYMHYSSAFAAGNPGLVCTSCNFDTFNGVIAEGGNFQMNGGGIGVQTGVNGFVMSTSGGGSNTTMKFSNIELTTQTFGSLFLMQNCTLCNLSIDHLNMTGGVNTVTLIGVTTSANSNVWLDHSYFNIGSLQMIVLNAFAPSAGVNNFHIDNNIVQTTPNVAFTNPIFQIQGSCPSSVNRATITNNRTIDKGTGAGTFISKACSQFDVIVNNVAPGWSYSLPTGVAPYAPNY